MCKIFGYSWYKEWLDLWPLNMLSLFTSRQEEACHLSANFWDNASSSEPSCLRLASRDSQLAPFNSRVLHPSIIHEEGGHDDSLTTHDTIGSCNFVIDSKEPQEPHKKAAASWCCYWTLSLSSYVTTHNHASAYWIGGRTKMIISISCVTKDQILASKSLQIIDRRNYSQTLCLIYHSISLYRLLPSIM